MRFRNEYAFLSNMYPSPVTIEINNKPYTFSCVEAAFQAHKQPSRAAEFTCIDGYAAKRLGRKVTLRPDWEDVKDDIMEKCVRQKFIQTKEGLDVQLMFLEGDIVEDNTWNDTYWGRCNGVGLNRLGEILMRIRDQLPFY